MDIKTQLFKIEELDAAKLLTGKPDEEFDKYVQKLHAFIDSFPDREAELHAALEKQDTAATVKLVEGARDLLVNIAAGALASECTKKLENLANEQFAKISEYVDSLITSLKTLSLDIQMALADKQEQAAEHAQAADESSDKPISEKTVMVVDDDSYCLDLIKRIVKSFPCKIICVTSGEKALVVLSKFQPDLFLLDIAMPVMDGIELAKRIKALGNKAPIIFITGNANKDSVIKAVKAGGADFILKPINHQNVTSRLNKFLKPA